MSRALLDFVRGGDDLFSREQFLALALSIGKSRRDGVDLEAVRTAVNEAARHYAFDLWREAVAHPSQTQRDAATIVRACNAILDAALVAPAGGTDRDNLKPHLGSGALFAGAAMLGEPRGAAAIANALAAVRNLGRFADVASRDAERAVANRGSKKRGRPDNAAVKAFVAGLADCFRANWGHPSVNRRSGEAEGPFVRFLVGVNAELHRRRLDHHRGSEALAKVWERVNAADDVDRTMGAL